MKKKQKQMTSCIFLLLFLMFIQTSCKDDDKQSAYDPSVPVEITRIDPEEGGVGTQCLIYGKNFGTDLSNIEVTFNGKKATLIGSDGSCIYCSVPIRAGSGSVKVTVGYSNEVQEAVSETSFKYKFIQRVSTLCGYQEPDGKSEMKDGLLSEAGFEYVEWLELDKKTGDLYILERQRAIRRLSIERDTLETIYPKTASIGHPRSLSFSPDGDTLYVSNDQDQQHGISVAVALRSTGFKKLVGLIHSTSCCGGDCHPLNPGEYFYDKWWEGVIIKWDRTTQESKELFQIANALNGTIQFAPSGDFAYIVDRNAHVIYKAMYDKTTHELQKAQPFVGARDQAGHSDNVGTAARFNEPQQGCFDEEGNFYVCDQGNYCIRKVEPTGNVTTFAGRPGEWGYADGDLRKEARFNRPHAIAYDAENKVFYVGDTFNQRIRMILTE